jgi:hypothetical protein
LLKVANKAHPEIHAYLIDVGITVRLYLIVNIH